MRILQICSASEMGGGEVHVADLVRALASRGHAVYLAVRPNSPLREPLAGVIASWQELPLRNSLDVQSSKAIAELIIKNRIEIVHAHLGRDYFIAAMAARRAKNCKLVLTRHHYLPMKSNPIYRWMLENVSAFIAVSDSVKNSILERIAPAPEKVQVIPNWIDPTRFHTIDREAARAMFQIRAPLSVACIGQLTPEKGQEEFVRAIGQISQRRSDVEYLIAGVEQEDGEPFTHRLKELAEFLGIAGRIRFMGYVHHIPELLAAVDVVVVPSWDEGFSLVTIEALACRRAVLASNVGGIRGIIKDNVTGALFPAREVNALAQKLLWILADSTMRDRLAMQGQIDASARFGRDNVIDQIEALYTGLLTKKS
ncbi:MAG: glycosyltransferase family 4 protein [Acidobacteriota bacterium]